MFIVDTEEFLTVIVVCVMYLLTHAKKPSNDIVSANEIASVRWLRFHHCERPSDPFISRGPPCGVFQFSLPYEWEANEPLVRWWIKFARCEPNLTRGLGSTPTSLKD